MNSIQTSQLTSSTSGAKGKAFQVLALLAEPSSGRGGVGQVLARLASWPGLDLEVSYETRGPRPGQVVLLEPGHRLPAEAVAELDGVVRGGGGVVTLAGSSADPRLAGLTGWEAAGRAPLTEVVVRPQAGHHISARLDSELRLVEAIELGLPPAGATPLLEVSWQFQPQVLAYVRPLGAGRVVHLGVGGTDRTLGDPVFAQLLWRCLRHAAGLPSGPVQRVGLLGYGAIAREHAEAIDEVEGLTLGAVCDRSAERRRVAAEEFGVESHAEMADLLADPALDVIVVGTPPNLHATSVQAALEAGKHVVCEKPLALSLAEVDRMLEAAAGADRVLTVYQNRRWDPDFVALRSAIAEGRIGEPFYMESFIGGFSHPCRHWHSHQPISGGAIFDWGSHYLDWIFQLLPAPVELVTAQAHNRVWHDVTNSDQVRVDIGFADGRQASFIHSDVAAVLKPKWYVLGTQGAIVGQWRAASILSRGLVEELVEDKLAPADSPAELSVFLPNGEGKAHRQVLALPTRRRHAFYRNLADHLAEDEPLAVLPEQSRRSVAVMEAAMRSIEAGGRQLEVNL